MENKISNKRVLKVLYSCNNRKKYRNSESEIHNYWLNRLRLKGIKKGFKAIVNYRPFCPIPPFNTLPQQSFLDVVWFGKDERPFCAFEVETRGYNRQIYKNAKKLELLAQNGIQVYHIRIMNEKPILLWSKGKISNKVYQGNNKYIQKTLDRFADRIKIQVKDTTLSSLLLRLSLIETHGNSLRTIQEKLGVSKQCLNYYLKQRIKEGLIERIQSYPYAIYGLTTKGKQVKEKLIQSEGKRDKLTASLWRCHNLIVGYPIASFGTYQFVDTSRRKIVQMQNWKYAREEVNGYVVNIQETGLLKIYCPEKYSERPDGAFMELGSEAQKVAQEFCNRFDMKLGQLKVIREGHKELQNSNKIAKVLGHFKTDECWTDASTGSLDLEEPQGSDKIEQLLELPALMKQMMVLQGEFSKNIALHLEVLTKMSNSLDVMNERLERLGK